MTKKKKLMLEQIANYVISQCGKRSGSSNYITYLDEIKEKFGYMPSKKKCDIILNIIWENEMVLDVEFEEDTDNGGFSVILGTNYCVSYCEFDDTENSQDEEVLCTCCGAKFHREHMMPSTEGLRCYKCYEDLIAEGADIVLWK